MLAPRLNRGDTIGIIAPSKPVGDLETEDQIMSGIGFLEKMGFKVELPHNLDSNDPKEKAEVVNMMFRNPEIKALMCAKGGDAAETLLPFIDWDLIRMNPKIICGYSDAGVLLDSFNKKTGLITFHGNDLNSFGKQQTEYDRCEFIRAMTKGEKGEVPANGERKTVRRGRASGRMLGGNLRCMLKLKNTEYWPDFNDSILFLESYKLNDTGMDLFEELKRLKVFEMVDGIIIGHNYGMQVLNPESRQMEDIILDMTKDYDFPILKINDFGHMCSQTVIPVGAKTEIDSDNKKITILEDYLKPGSFRRLRLTNCPSDHENQAVK